MVPSERLSEEDWEKVYDWEREQENRYDKGDTNIILYRLMRYLPSDPETLYSAVGATGFDQERMGTSKFSLHGINTDIKAQGFFATPTPGEAATWIRYSHLKNDIIPAEKGDPFDYAVFPIVAGKFYNSKYWDEHPEIFEAARFGIADGLIVDDFMIIGEPLKVWHTAYKPSEKEVQRIKDNY